MDLPELDAFTDECRAAEDTLAAVGADAWGRPALGEWTLHELGAHLVGAAARLAEYAAQADQPDPAADQPACDRVGYWQMDLAAAAPAVAERARERAALLPSEEVAGAFGRSWRTTGETVARLGAGSLVPTLRGPMLVEEYLATRVVEVCIHHLDVRSALDLPPTSTPAASRMTMALLESLLGGPRPRNLGRSRFILVATGRAPSDDPRFPLIR